jgi:hypothetical protein
LREENQALLRRLYGNKTERLHTDETQLAFADLLEDKQAATAAECATRSGHEGGSGRWQRAAGTHEAQG